jgi:hypothetical protein
MERKLALVLSYCRYASLTTFPTNLNRRGNEEGADSGSLILQVCAIQHLSAPPEQERNLALVLSFCRYAPLTTFLPHLNRRGSWLWSSHTAGMRHSTPFCPT